MRGANFLRMGGGNSDERWSLATARDDTVRRSRTEGTSGAPIARPPPRRAGDRAPYGSPQSGFASVAAKSRNITLKLTLMRFSPLAFGSTEWGSQAGKTSSVPGATFTTT